MIELTSKQFHSLTGAHLIALVNLTDGTKYRAVWVDGERVWVWKRQDTVFVSPTIAPDERRRCGHKDTKVSQFGKAPTEITQEYLEKLGYQVVVKPSGYIVMKDSRIVAQVDDGRNVHERYALRAIAVNRRLAWEKVREDYAKS